MLRQILVGALACLASPSFADDLCSSLLASGSVSQRPALFAFSKSSASSTSSARWEKMQSRDSVYASPSLMFAVAARSYEKPQTLVLKARWKQGQTQDSSVVRLTRDPYKSPCRFFR
jgi:hypothetical protein